jgi:glycosyltransferase involved in cell wall biosynthesis
MMVSPIFSIIIATHKRPQLLRRAIASVKAQDHPLCQLIVVSDVNDLQTYQVFHETSAPGDVYCQGEGAVGPSESRNMALAHASGDYVLFLDDDDAYRAGFLRALQVSIASLPEHQVFYTNYEVNEQGPEPKVSAVDLAPLQLDQVWAKNCIPNNCVVYARAIAQRIRYDKDMAYEDWDYLLSAFEIQAPAHLPIFGPLIYKNSEGVQVHRGEANNNERLFQCYINIYKKHPPRNALGQACRQSLFQSIGLELADYV